MLTSTTDCQIQNALEHSRSRLSWQATISLLAGTIPQEWSTLRNLTFLDLFWNQISGTIPSIWPSTSIVFAASFNHVWPPCGHEPLDRLHIYLSTEQSMTSSIATSHFTSTALTSSLWLQLSGQMPPWSNITMPNLTQLKLDTNSLQDQLPPELMRYALPAASIRVSQRLPAWSQLSTGLVGS